MNYTHSCNRRRSSDVASEIEFVEIAEASGSEYTIDGFMKISRSDTSLGLKGIAMSGFEVRTMAKPRPVVSSAVDLSWLSELYLSGENTRISSSRLTAVIVNINTLLKTRNFDTISFILSALQLDRVAPEVLIAFSRITYPVRSLLPNWTKFVGRVETALAARGIDAKPVMRGLR